MDPAVTENELVAAVEGLMERSEIDRVGQRRPRDLSDGNPGARLRCRREELGNSDGARVQRLARRVLGRLGRDVVGGPGCRPDRQCGERAGEQDPKRTAQLPPAWITGSSVPEICPLPGTAAATGSGASSGRSVGV